MALDNMNSQELDQQIRQYRSKLLPYAYNILGDYMEAEDVVHQVLNKFFLDREREVLKPNNYLIRSVINRSINQKKQLFKQLEHYPGEWLPAPVYSEENIYQSLDKKHILDYSLLVLLEHLNAKQRAVFILKEAFGYAHNEIAAILDISTAHSRQLLKRGRDKIPLTPIAPPPVDEKSKAQVQSLADAILKEDIPQIKKLLCQQVKAISDGGPKQSAARKIINGQSHVYKLLRAIYGKYMPSGATFKYTELNHRPAIVYMFDGVVFRSIIFDIEEGQIRNIYIMVNPDKLNSLH